MKSKSFYSTVLLTIFFPLAAFCEVQTVFLTWEKNPDTSMSIQWITRDDDLDNQVKYHKADNNEIKHATASYEPLPADPSYFLHRINLIDLDPDTIYSFQIAEEDASYKFRTMPATLEKAISFVEGGDLYYKNLSYMEKTCRTAAATHPYFALLGGDLADSIRYEGPAEMLHWLEWLVAWEKNMKTPDGCLVPIVTAIGNHEVKGKFHQTPQNAKMFYAFFPMTDGLGYRALDFGNYMSVILLDSGHTYEVLGEQTDWLRKTLESKEDFPNKFAVYHVPAFPAANAFKDVRIRGEIQQSWVPLFEKYGLNAAFEHHEHAYKRTHPILNGQIDEAGVVYIGEGAWGPEKVHAISENFWYIAKAESKRHFILVTLLENHSCLFQAMDSNGTVMDEYHNFRKSFNLH